MSVHEPLRRRRDPSSEPGASARNGSRRGGPLVGLLLFTHVLAEHTIRRRRWNRARREGPWASASRRPTRLERTGGDGAPERALPRGAGPREVRLIEPRRQGVIPRLVELWRHRRLTTYFGRRYIEKRYARTWLGWLWIPLRPTLDVGSRVLLFGALLAVPSEGKPYLIFFLVGVSAWGLFSESAYWATRSLELNRSTLKRLYVPRLTVLIAAVAPGLLNYGLYAAITVIVVVYFLAVEGTFHLDLGPDVLVALGGLGLVVALGLAIGLWTSVYGAQARDVRFGLRYLLNLWLFVTPVIYPLSAVPDGLRSLVAYNPMTAPIEMVRHGLLGTGGVPMTSLWITIGTIGVLGSSGLWFFARSETAALDSL